VFLFYNNVGILSTESNGAIRKIEFDNPPTISYIRVTRHTLYQQNTETMALFKWPFKRKTKPEPVRDFKKDFLEYVVENESGTLQELIGHMTTLYPDYTKEWIEKQINDYEILNYIKINYPILRHWFPIRWLRFPLWC